MDYYQFFSQLKEMNNNTPANNSTPIQPTTLGPNTSPYPQPSGWWEANNNSPNENNQGKDLLTLPVNNNSSNSNNNVNTSSSLNISAQMESILESQRMIQDLNSKKENNNNHNNEPLPVSTKVSTDNNSNLASQLQHFMSTVEKKIESLESTVHLLTAEFHNFSQHQGNYNNEFLRALSQLSSDISNAKSTVAQVSTVSLSKSSSYSISPAYNVENVKVQEENDAEIARKLQEEFDKVNSSPKPPVPVVNSLYPISQSNSIYPVSQANNIYNNNQALSSSISQPPVPSNSSSAAVEKEECPFCQVLFPIKELQVHVENHLREQGSSLQSPPPPPSGVQLATSPSSQDQGFFSKLFGKNNTQKAPTSVVPPPQPKPVIINRPPGQMVIPAPGGGYYSPVPVPVPQGSMVYRPYPPPQGYPQPQPQPPQLQPQPPQLQPQIVYINPDGTPYKPQQ